jgi:hypothetical protein
MVYVMGAVIGARIGFTPVQTEEHDAIDGELSYRVFQLMQLHDQRMIQVYEQQHVVFHHATLASLQPPQYWGHSS